MNRPLVTVDGNEAAANVAHQVSEVIAIYPITPSSAMGELADAWSARGRTNLWGTVPQVVEMQSEGGAAGALHGALQAGALATTFTASQGLLLMIPNMFKIAGELTPFVMHVAARTVATHALSIFGDHSDVMAARTTGFAMLCASSVQEAQDLALVAHAATLETRVPFLHFFDGFRTSHEVNKIEQLTEEDMRAMIDDGLVRAHRARALSPAHPVLRGSAQNPDVFFQAREAANPFHDAVPQTVARTMEAFAAMTGRRYGLFDYVGAPDADRVLVLMGSGCGAAEEAVEELGRRGERVGMVKVRLFRPFSASAFVSALPASVRSIAVLDRTKEPGALGEPLYQDVVTALHEQLGANEAAMPAVIGGRYGLSSKEFTPAMAAAVFAELARPEPRRHFTVGIVDDVTHLSLPVDEEFQAEDPDAVRAVFFGLGSDGTVSANRNAIKIIGEQTPLYAQGYFVLDSKKAGSQTVSHLRFGSHPIRSTYQIRRATFVACHQFAQIHREELLDVAEPGATVLLNSPYPAQEIWEHLPRHTQEQILGKGLRMFVIDADRIAKDAGLGTRVNTVLQTCFFALAQVIPRERAIEQIKAAIARSYGKRGRSVVERNEVAVDHALAGLHEVDTSGLTPDGDPPLPAVPDEAPDFVRRVTAKMLAGQGDLLPVSALPVDGTFPTGTASWEKRSIAREIPIWDPAICIDCGKCALVCPHAAIRMKVFEPGALDEASAQTSALPHKEWKGRDLPGMLMTIQVAPDDCTGCGVCVDVCPAKSKEEVRHKAIDMEPKMEHLDVERARFDAFLELPPLDRTRVRVDTVKGSQLLEPLFEFSGACAGCGETPYLKLLTQMFGDRTVVANATGCSSIYGGNLPTTPWSTNAQGLGPAWSNSLFEDNAEFGLGMRLGIDHERGQARHLLALLAPQVGEQLASEILEATDARDEAGIAAQRERVQTLKGLLSTMPTPDAENLLSLADALVRTDVWIVGGDGWAYDIGFGGLDHVLASGRDVNVLVLDTEVYSNTGGQASKATPRGAVAKFAAAGKTVGKKDLGMIAAAYGNVYVAQIAIGADSMQAVRALSEAEAHPGPSIVIAYSQCIAHGIDMSTGMTHQKEAVDSGYWPLYRYDPARSADGVHPLHLDSKAPSIPLKEFADKETRFAMLARSDPDRAAALMGEAQRDVQERRHLYEQLAGVERAAPAESAESGTSHEAPEEDTP